MQQSVIYQEILQEGDVPANVEAQVQALELPKLEALGEALLDFTGVVGWQLTG